MTTKIRHTPGGVQSTNNKENHCSAPQIKNTNEKHPLQHKSPNILLSKRDLINQSIVSKHYRTKRKITTPLRNKTMSTNQSSITTYLIRHPTKPAAKLLGSDQPQGNCNETNKMPTSASLKHHNLQHTQQNTLPSPLTTDTILYNSSPSTALTIRSVSSSSASPQQLTLDSIDEVFHTAETASSQLRPKSTHIVDLTNGPLTGGDKCNSGTNNCQGKLIDLTNVPDTYTNSENVVYPARDQQTGIVSITIDLLPKNNWQPRHRLLYQTVNHPFVDIIQPQVIHSLMVAARQDPEDVIVYLSHSKAQTVTTASIRELLSHGEMTNDSILNTFLAILCDAHNVAFLSTFFIHILKRDKSWEGVQHWFAQYPIFETYSVPFVTSNRPILIPCHVNGAHWVGIVRRVIANKVYFLYADGLNSVSMENRMKDLLQTHTPPEFYPHDAIWLTC
jgi:hypothetical protein